MFNVQFQCEQIVFWSTKACRLWSYIHKWSMFMLDLYKRARIRLRIIEFVWISVDCSKLVCCRLSNSQYIEASQVAIRWPFSIIITIICFYACLFNYSDLWHSEYVYIYLFKNVSPYLKSSRKKRNWTLKISRRQVYTNVWLRTCSTNALK